MNRPLPGLLRADASSALSLGEGGTPLVPSMRLGRELGLNHLWFKLENLNPTGSYKDRFAAAAVRHAVAMGKKLCLGTSSGNAGAALAAYCAKAGLPCALAIVEGAPDGKLRQMLAYGARLIRIRGFGANPLVTREVMEGLRPFAAELGASLEISAFAFAPKGMAGVQTLSAELADTLAGVPLSVFSPAGGGGLTLAIARGFTEYWEGQGRSSSARVHCVQPAGNDTIATPLRQGALRAREVTSTTGVSGLQVGSVIDGDAALAACRQSGGNGYVVTDERVFHWQRRLARDEGIFCEPAGAVALAGAEQAVRCGEISADEHVVCVVTGAGFKDERALARLADTAEIGFVDSFSGFEALLRRDSDPSATPASASL